MKKILVLGVGAQGSTIAKRLQEEPQVEEIVCADYDARAAEDVEKSLSKATALQVDASNAKDAAAEAGESRRPCCASARSRCVRPLPAAPHR